MLSILVEDYLMVGQNAVVRKIVQKADSAGNYSFGLQDLLSTPVCVDMIIKATTDAVNKYLPDGYITVGQSVNYVHDSASLLGMTVNVKATLASIEGKLLVFNIVVWDEMGEVGHGTHERLVVKRDEVLQKARERANFLVQRTF
jgi:predicted thioesterase